MATATDSAVLTLAQWLSPAYPVGAFAYSHGLEAAAEAGWVTGATELEAWLEDVLRHGAGWSDALFIAAAFHATGPQRVAEVDATARAFAASKERLAETSLQGAAFCTATAGVWGSDIEGLTYPVALGRAARLENLPLGLTSAIYMQAFASNLVAAGQRLLPVGQTEGQAILRRLAPVCRDIAAATVTGDLDLLSATAFLSDIAAMKHETQHSRIFRT